MSRPVALRPQKLADAVQDAVLELIREEGLGPGDPLPSERALMARYDVGRPAVREALQGLAHMGILEIRHGGRARLAAPSLEGVTETMGVLMRHVLTHGDSTLEHLKDARALLESEMARLAAQARSPYDLADLRDLLERQHAAKGDPAEFTTLDGQFHRRIAQIPGNPVFEALVHGVFSWMRAFHADQVHARGNEALTLAEHESILEAIEAGDPPAAAQAMRNHLTRANALYHKDNAT